MRNVCCYDLINLRVVERRMNSAMHGIVIFSNVLDMFSEITFYLVRARPLKGGGAGARYPGPECSIGACGGKVEVGKIWNKSFACSRLNYSDFSQN